MIRRLSYASDRLQWLAWLILLTVIAYNVNQALTLDRRDPIDGPMLTEALNSPVRAGEPLLVRITRDKIRGDCPVQSERAFIGEDGRKVSADIGRHEGGSPNQSFVDWSYPTPSFLPPGQYELRVELMYTCPKIDAPFRHTQEPVRFRIVE